MTIKTNSSQYLQLKKYLQLQQTLLFSLSQTSGFIKINTSCSIQIPKNEDYLNSTIIQFKWKKIICHLSFKIESYPPSSYTVICKIPNFLTSLTRNSISLSLDDILIQLDSLFLKKCIEFIPTLSHSKISSLPLFYLSITQTHIDFSFTLLPNVSLPISYISSLLSALSSF
ncbi:hypothetical protein ENUP19_0181G0005 [Entamoeba nuttalli]|uniref:Uncharacterized protein n=1 Tax=Entamoeba nuttalli TaxID=412467 RepID=A0ABQ0DN06_9EUKA